MIIDHISNLKQYDLLGENFPTARRFLETTRLDSLQPGRYEIDGERVFANVVERDLTEMPTTWEMHQKYADIHLILSGSEAFGYYPASRLEAYPTSFGDDDGALLHGLKGSFVALEAGEFLIAMPQDAHLSNCPGAGAAHCKKLILKIMVSP